MHFTLLQAHAPLGGRELVARPAHGVRRGLAGPGVEVVTDGVADEQLLGPVRGLDLGPGDPREPVEASRERRAADAGPPGGELALGDAGLRGAGGKFRVSRQQTICQQRRDVQIAQFIFQG